MDQVRYRHTPEMGEISGFGGGYEECCQDMLEAGVLWLSKHPAATLDGHSFKNIYGIFEADSDDAMAGHWATANDIPVQVFNANWTKHGKSAGAVRNRDMLTRGKPDMVVAFPGGRGTANMVEIATDARVKVALVSEDAP